MVLNMSSVYNILLVSISDVLLEHKITLNQHNQVLSFLTSKPISGWKKLLHQKKNQGIKSNVGMIYWQFYLAV